MLPLKCRRHIKAVTYNRYKPEKTVGMKLT